MPILNCNSDNQDTASRLSLEIQLLDYEKFGEEKWLNYTIIFKLGSNNYIFNSKRKEATTHLGSIAEVGKFAFIIEPHNELKIFSQDLALFLDSKRQNFTFQPADPSFEIIIERIQNPLTKQDEFKVYCWVDAGNTNQLEYTWDGIGIRFLCSEGYLKSFCQELDLLRTISQ